MILTYEINIRKQFWEVEGLMIMMIKKEKVIVISIEKKKKI